MLGENQQVMRILDTALYVAQHLPYKAKKLSDIQMEYSMGWRLSALFQVPGTPAKWGWLFIVQ